MEVLLNVGALFFMVSGMFAWAFGLFLVWYYWLCSPKGEE
mgnify:CR=1 FL=1|tara:strand:+ start:443 stop:562 length:120 start_codon:yes stop_codon:yes gene_type:complete